MNKIIELDQREVADVAGADLGGQLGAVVGMVVGSYFGTLWVVSGVTIHTVAGINKVNPNALFSVAFPQVRACIDPGINSFLLLPAKMFVCASIGAAAGALIGYGVDFLFSN